MKAHAGELLDDVIGCCRLDVLGMKVPIQIADHIGIAGVAPKPLMDYQERALYRVIDDLCIGFGAVLKDNGSASPASLPERKSAAS